LKDCLGPGVDIGKIDSLLQQVRAAFERDRMPIF
jgi:hypothetical protein